MGDLSQNPSTPTLTQRKCTHARVRMLRKHMRREQSRSTNALVGTSAAGDGEDTRRKRTRA
eukprot:6321992-Alexandrium_andersonii.AAC.1